MGSAEKMEIVRKDQQHPPLLEWWSRFEAFPRIYSVVIKQVWFIREFAKMGWQRNR